MRETASVDKSIVGQVAKNHLAGKHRGTEDDDDEITVVEMEDVQKEEREELDGLTMEELRSLLQNFQNLSRQEQADMIAYMRRLEVRDPEKVRRLKLGLPQWNSNGQEDDVVVQQQSNGEAGGSSGSQQREDWSPINKRRRRLDLAATQLDINPAAPAPNDRGRADQGQLGTGGGDRDQQQLGDGEWEGVGEQPQDRGPQWPRGPSWEDQQSSTWSNRRNNGPSSYQERPYQHGW